ATDLAHLLRPARDRRADTDLDRLSRLRADRERVLEPQVADDRFVELVAPDTQRARQHDPPERDHGDLARTAADVDDHPSDRLGDVEPRPDRGGDRLLDQVHVARAGGERGLLDGALLDLRDAGWRAHDQTGMGSLTIENLTDEVAQHLLGDLEVGDHAVTQRAAGGDRRRRAPDHPLGVRADRVHLPAAGVGRHDRRLGDHDPLTLDVDQRVRGPEIDRHVADPEAGGDVTAGDIATRAVAAKTHVLSLADPRGRRASAASPRSAP